VSVTTPSCPRCGAAAPASASRCESCGFVFFEMPARRKLPRPSPRALLAIGAVLAGAVGLVVLLTRDSPPPPPPAPVPPSRAEVRLVRQLDLPGSVHCAGSIRPGRATRCQFLYPDGDTQLMLVTLTAAGALEIDVPYPAQRRPGR
jgi:hypothetical protein